MLRRPRRHESQQVANMELYHSDMEVKVNIGLDAKDKFRLQFHQLTWRM